MLGSIGRRPAVGGDAYDRPTFTGQLVGAGAEPVHGYALARQRRALPMSGSSVIVALNAVAVKRLRRHRLAAQPLRESIIVG
jgi:hypothetical protein